MCDICRKQEWAQRRSQIMGSGGRENNDRYYLEDGSSDGENSNNGSRGNGDSGGDCGRQKSRGESCGTTCEGEACKVGEGEACTRSGNAQQCSADRSQDLHSPNSQCFHDVF